MRYKVNARCTKCGRALSYWSDDEPAAKVCPVPHELTEAELVAMPREELRKRCPDEWLKRPSPPGAR